MKLFFDTTHETSSFFNDREHKNVISGEKSITRFCLQGEVILGRWKIKSTMSRLANNSKYDAENCDEKNFNRSRGFD